MSKDYDREHQFGCRVCGEAGVIWLPDKFLTFGCPANCGATFAKYQGQVGWAIRCVVEPIFATAERDTP